MEKQSTPPKKQGEEIMEEIHCLSGKEEITSPTQILPDKAADEMPEIVGQTPMPDTVEEKVMLEKLEEETTNPMPARDEMTTREDIKPTGEEEMLPKAEEITPETPIAVPAPDITPTTGEEMLQTALMPTGEEMPLTGEEMPRTAVTLIAEEITLTGEEMPPTAVMLTAQEIAPTGEEMLQTAPMPTGEEMPLTGEEMPQTAVTLIAEEITLTGEEMPPTAVMLTAQEITPTGEEMLPTAVTLTAGVPQIRTETRIPTIARENIRIRSLEIQTETTNPTQIQTETTRDGTLPRTKLDHVVVDISQQAKTEVPAPQKKKRERREKGVSKLTLNATLLGAAATAFFGVDQKNFLNFLGLVYLFFFASAAVLLVLGKIRGSRNLMIWGTHATSVTTALTIILIGVAAAFARK